MYVAEIDSRKIFGELKPGDRVQIEHTVIVGSQSWKTSTLGTVVRKERRKQGLHFRRNPDDKVYSDMLVLKRDDGELTTITLDEYTAIKRT